MKRKGAWLRSLVVLACMVGAVLAVAVSQASASANVLVMPNRQAIVDETVVVWGNTKLANGTAFTLNFGDGTPATVGNVIDRSYIAVQHVYTTPGLRTVTLTVGGESETALVEVLDPAALSAFALRGVRVNMAIEDGLRSLYFRQFNRAARFDTNMTSWRSQTVTDDHTMAFSSLVILAFENHGHDVLDDPNKSIYQALVQRGLNFIFDGLFKYTLQDGGVNEPAGSPCVGVPNNADKCTGLGTNAGAFTRGYASSVTTLAVAGAVAGGASNRIVAAGLGSQNAFFVAGRTYGEILQRLSNTVVWGQSDSLPGQGGFYYFQDAGNLNDGSALGWGVLALLDAPAAGATVPAFSKTQLANGLNNSINNDGSLDYQVDSNPASNNAVNVAKTGIALQALSYIGAAVGDARVQNALDYISDRWNSTNAIPMGQSFACFGGTPSGFNKGCGYAMFNVFKALRLYGINTLPGVTRPAGPGPIPAGDWYADYVDNLLANQHSPTMTTGGDWSQLVAPQMGWSCCDSDQHGISALALLILAPVALVLPNNIDLAPATDTNPPGTQHTVTATARAANNAPVPGAQIVFAIIAGPNAGNAGDGTTKITNANGQATFTYTSNGQLGTDQIRASIGQIQSNIAFKTWGAGAPNLRVSTGTRTRINGTLEVELRIKNAGGSEAKLVTIGSVTPRAPVTYIGPALPINKGDIAAGAIATQILQMNINNLAANTIVRFTVKGTFQDGGGKKFGYSAILSVRIP